MKDNTGEILHRSSDRHYWLSDFQNFFGKDLFCDRELRGFEAKKDYATRRFEYLEKTNPSSLKKVAIEGDSSDDCSDEIE